MTFEQFKEKYQKVPVEEFPNKRKGTTPIVTVKVLAYNHADYIEQCLDSILMQETDFDFEILLLEDESKDGTRKICVDYAIRHPNKIRLFLNSRANNIEVSGKPSGLFNSIYANYMISSKYISICEGDDYWSDTNSLNKKVSCLEENEGFVMAFSNFNRLVSNTGELQIRPSIKLNKDTVIEKEDILKANIQTVSNVFRNNLIDKYDPKMSEVILGDFILKGKLSHYGKAYYIHDIKPEIYRIHNEGSFSIFSRWQQAQETIKALEYLVDHYRERKQNDLHIVKNLVFFCLHSFLRNLLSSRTIRMELIRKARHYALLHDISVLSQSFNAIKTIIANFIYSRSSSSQTQTQ